MKAFLLTLLLHSGLLHSGVFGAAVGPSEPLQPAESDKPAADESIFPSLTVSLVDRDTEKAVVARWDRIRDATDDVVMRIDHALAAANHRLSVDAEPMLSRLYFGIEQAGDREMARSILDDVRARLSAAEPWVRSETNSGDAEQLRLRVTRWNQISAFADAVASWLSSATDEETLASRRRAVSGLSILLEDDRADISAAASFWQVLLLARMDAMKQAFRRLEVVTAPPRRGAVRWDFFRRCLRGRLLIEQGRYPVADAALLTLEEKARPWFNPEEKKELASRTAAWLRYRTLAKWHGSAVDAGKAQEAAWVAASARRLIDDSFEGGELTTVFRLGQAVPIVADLERGD